MSDLALFGGKPTINVKFKKHNPIGIEEKKQRLKLLKVEFFLVFGK